MAHASIWVQTHTIHYRPVPENDPSNYASPSVGKSAPGQSGLLPCGAGGASGTRKGKGTSGKSAAKKKGDDLWNGESLPGVDWTSRSHYSRGSIADGVAPDVNSPIVPFLTMRLPEYVTIEDPSLEVLNLLRAIHALGRHWGFLYNVIDYKPVLPNHDWINTKLTAKANRQLQVRVNSN